MNFRYKGWKINSSTIIRFEWRKYYPKLILHERYQATVNRTLLVLTGIGIITAFITLSPNEAFLLSIALLIIEKFLEKILFEYTVIVPHGIPDFPVDNQQWTEIGFAWPANRDAIPLIGPVYNDEEYAIKFFNYIKSWGVIGDDDPDNTVILSFVIEPEGYYTTYIYPNIRNPIISAKFDYAAEKMKYDKYGKNQQDLIAIPAYYKQLPLWEDGYMNKFLGMTPQGQPFSFAPWVFDPDGPAKLLYDEKFTMHNYKLTRREDLQPSDLEYYYQSLNQII